MPDTGGMRTPVLLLLAALLAACSSDPEAPSADPTPTATAAGPVTVEYSPGLTEDLYLPAERGEVPLVVMVPGGGWTTADPSGFTGLATSLAAAGIAAAPTHIRASQDGVVYPIPVEDVLCAVAGAVAETVAQGFDPGPVAVLGHSSGAHLASLAVLAFDDFAPECLSPVVEPDALVGLAGPYDIGRITQYSSELFAAGPDEDPDTWAAANPVLRTDLRADVPVLLLNGDSDAVVAPEFAEQFAEALEDAGNPTTLEVIPGADHFSIFAPYVVGEPIARWLLGLA